jgi:hypothetical protein
MFSETLYALNGDLRVAYRASREGPRDIVFVSNWFFCCEALPELPSLQGWVDAMTSLGRLKFFDQPGTAVSDPVTAAALPTLEQWADSITRAARPGRRPSCCGIDVIGIPSGRKHANQPWPPCCVGK